MKINNFCSPNSTTWGRSVNSSFSALPGGFAKWWIHTFSTPLPFLSCTIQNTIVRNSPQVSEQGDNFEEASCLTSMNPICTSSKKVLRKISWGLLSTQSSLSMHLALVQVSSLSVTAVAVWVHTELLGGNRNLVSLQSKQLKKEGDGISYCFTKLIQLFLHIRHPQRGAFSQYKRANQNKTKLKDCFCCNYYYFSL